MTTSKSKIQLAMARAQMNLVDIAERAQMPKATVEKALSGKSVLPATLGKIAAALQVDPAELLDTERQ